MHGVCVCVCAAVSVMEAYHRLYVGDLAKEEGALQQKLALGVANTLIRYNTNTRRSARHTLLPSLPHFRTHIDKSTHAQKLLLTSTASSLMLYDVLYRVHCIYVRVYCV